jgi:predicted GNAT family N-acyltransferase
MLAFREVAHRSPEYEACVRLRDRILRAPLGLAFSREELDAETGDWHLAGFAGDQDEPGACLVLSPLSPGVAKMRQVAVAENLRGKGQGKAIVEFAERLAKDRGVAEFVLNARENVVAFYEKLGYEAEGEIFVEVTIPHRKMRKRLMDRF